MANRHYIIDNEYDVRKAVTTLHEVTDVYFMELAKNEGAPHDENRDCWGTLRANIQELARAADDFIRLTANEFGG